MVQKKMPILIDTDGGVDDALAILFALRSPELNVHAINAVGGVVSVDQAYSNILQTLSIVAPQNEICLGKGADLPLYKAPFRAENIHGKDGLGDLKRFNDEFGAPCYPKIVESKAAYDAIDLIYSSSAKFPGELIIIAIGPLTNLAKAILKDCGKMQGIKRIISMGGAFTVPGNITPAAEFNFFIDPDAAQVVLASGIPVTFVGLDVALKAPLPRSVILSYQNRYPSKISQWIIDISEKYSDFYKTFEKFDGFYLHDPLAVAVAIDPSLVETEHLYVAVETKGEFTTGFSLVDRRMRKDTNLYPPNADVALGIDQKRFLQLFHDRVW